MKRLAVLGIVFLMLTSLVFAQVKFEPKVTLSANATLTWGIDLSTFDTGFSNAADADLTVTLIAADSTDTHKGEGAAYGEIKISDIELVLGGDDAANDFAGVFSDWLVDADVSAKIVVPPFEFGIYAAPTMYMDSITEIEVDANDDEIVDIEPTYYAGGGGAAVQPFATTYGTWVGGVFGPLTAKLKIASTDWTQDPADNAYAVGLEGSFAIVPPATVAFGGYADWVSSRYGFYFKPSITSGPLAAWFGMEGNYVATDFAFVVGAGATYTIREGTTLSTTAVYGEPVNGLDVKIAFVEPGDKGLIPMFDLALTAYLLDITVMAPAPIDMEYQFIATGGYKIVMNERQYVRPFLTIEYGAGNDDVDLTAAVPYDYTNRLYVNPGVQFQLIPLTLFTVQWVSGDLLPDGAIPADTGSIQFVAKVTY